MSLTIGEVMTRDVTTVGPDAAAGLGSVYITANLLHFTRQSTFQQAKAASRKKKSKKRLPSFVKKVEEKEPELKPLTNKVDANILKRSIADGDRWFV